MFKINSETNNISVTRGNSFELSVKPIIAESEETYVPAANDKILFTVKGSTGKTYVKKLISGTECADDGTITISISPADTLNMKPFVYSYDILLVKQNGEAYTFIDKSDFTLLEAIGTVEDLEENGDVNEN
jgi:hypothetical protein